MPFRSPFGKKNRGNNNNLNSSSKHEPKFSQLIVSDVDEYTRDDDNDEYDPPEPVVAVNTTTATSKKPKSFGKKKHNSSTAPLNHHNYGSKLSNLLLVHHNHNRNNAHTNTDNTNNNNNNDDDDDDDDEARDTHTTPSNNNNNNNNTTTNTTTTTLSHPSVSTASTLSTAQNCDGGIIDVDDITFGTIRTSKGEEESSTSTFSYLNDLGRGHRSKHNNNNNKGEEKETGGGVGGGVGFEVDDQLNKQDLRPSITFEQYIDTSSPPKPQPQPSSSSPPTKTNNSQSSLTTSNNNNNNNNRRRNRAALKNAAAIAERDYWKEHLLKSVVQYGPVHVKIADCLHCLGCAHMKCKEYSEALSVYKSTVRIQRQIHGSDHLSVGRALDRVGLAASYGNTPHNHDWALAALKEAFLIRYNNLGPHHCDTADTLNNIAGVHLRRNDLEEARKAYGEVLTVRAAILGRDHPAVAVTAHTLGKVYMRLSDHSEALRHFEFSLRIYREALRLKDSNPTVAKVLKDKDSTERILFSMGYHR